MTTPTPRHPSSAPEALRPRDIQARVRAGASVSDLAEASGMAPHLVERFAGPVLAERIHVAQTAMVGSIRRRDETSSASRLSAVVAERLASVEVDPERADWDAVRRPDGRWTVSVTYDIGEETRRAEFLYHPQGRFSQAENEEARGLIAERAWPPVDDDNEPTVDLVDEFALAQAVSRQERSTAPGDGPLVPTARPVEEAAKDELADPDPTPGVTGIVAASGTGPAGQIPPAHETPVEMADRELASYDVGYDTADHAPPDAEEPSSELDALLSMFAEPPAPTVPGPSDASAVPETDNAGWAPAQDLTVPYEPSLFDDDPTVTAGVEAASTVRPSTAQPSPPPTGATAPEPRVRRALRRRRAAAKADPTPASAVSVDAGDADPADTAQVGASPLEAQPVAAGVTPSSDAPSSDAPSSDAPSSDAPSPEAPSDGQPTEEGSAEAGSPTSQGARSRRRKGRAAVPSWDEIMFGPTRGT